MPQLGLVNICVLAIDNNSDMECTRAWLTKSKNGHRGNIDELNVLRSLTLAKRCSAVHEMILD